MLTFYLKFDYKNLGLRFVPWPVSMTVCFLSAVVASQSQW